MRTRRLSSGRRDWEGLAVTIFTIMAALCVVAYLGGLAHELLSSFALYSERQAP